MLDLRGSPGCGGRASQLFGFSLLHLPGDVTENKAADLERKAGKKIQNLFKSLPYGPTPVL